MPEVRFHARCPLRDRSREPAYVRDLRPRSVTRCPDPQRSVRCEQLVRLGSARWCELRTEREAGERMRLLRAEEWFAQIGEDMLALAIDAELERMRLLFALAVRCDEAGPPLAEWLVQASFDPDPTMRRLTGAAIAVVGLFVPARRREAHDVLLRARERGGPELDPALAALTAAGSWDTGPGLRRALFAAAPEVRASLLAAWAGQRLSGRALREQEWRRIAGHVHPGRRAEALLRRLRRAHSTRDVRHLLQRLGERRGRRATTPLYTAVHDELPAPPWYQLTDEDYDDHVYEPDADDSEAWPRPVPSPAQQVALAMLRGLYAARAWSGQIGQRLSLSRRLELWRLHSAAADSLDARIAGLLADDAPLRTLAAIELLVLARRDAPDLERPLDAAALLPDVLAHLRAAPPDDLQRRGEALRVLSAGAPAVMRAIVESIADVHPDQRPLVMLAALCPAGPGTTPWVEREAIEDLLHSGLAPLLMRGEPAPDLDPYPESQRPLAERALQLFRSGAGSLHSLDYPEFSLTCRSSLSVVRPEHLGELREIGAALADLSTALAADDPHRLLAALDAAAGLEPAADDGCHARLVAHACAYATLRVEVMPGETSQIREAHVRRFEARRDELTFPPPTTLTDLRHRFGAALTVEGLAHAMLAFAREPPGCEPSQRAQQRRAWAHRVRLLALLYALPPAPRDDPDEPEETARRLVGHLIQAFEHAPLELCQALHVPQRQGLPQLAGAAAPIERRLQKLLRRALQLEQRDDLPPTRFTCRPLDKQTAVGRGLLGRDCSSHYVPLRALSPHHVYYGLFDEHGPRPGYMTVFEAFAAREGGARAPVLVLETINVHDGALDAVQQDLLRIFEVIARARGLAGLVVVSGIGTWNYANERLVTAARRHRQGERVRLMPPDASLWRAHERLSHEEGRYCSFRGAPSARLLAPFDARRDVVQPENAAEAARLEQLPRRSPQITGRDRDGEPAAFISAIPGSAEPAP